ncbi:MAG: hypothetical protein JW940_26695 [Polyangiaceae bacterium]|nr:hypothetical protein [Polyangiaceae bacterium]
MTLLTRLSRRISSYASCVALGYAALLASSVLLCIPTLAVLSELGVGRLPTGDRSLFEPGALLLFEVVRIGRARLTSSLESSALSAALTSLLALPVAAAVMVRLERPGRTAWRLWLACAVRPLSTFLLIGGVTMLCRACVLVLLGFSAAHYRDVVFIAFGAKPADLTLLALALVAMVLMALLGVLQDLARAAAVTHQADGYSALGCALLLARRHVLRWLVPWSIAAAGTLAALLVVATATALFDLSRAGVWRPAAHFLVCQTAIVLAFASRIWWLDRALRLVRVYARAPMA